MLNGKPHAKENLDLLELFFKFAKEEANVSQVNLADVKSVSLSNPARKSRNLGHPVDKPLSQHIQATGEKYNLPLASDSTIATRNLERRLHLGHRATGVQLLLVFSVPP